MLTAVKHSLPRDAKPACATPEGLALVDAAFERAGGPESQRLRANLCADCPVRLECFLLGNATGEHGIWGGLNTNERVRAGGRSARGLGNNYVNLAGIDSGPRRRRGA